MAQDTGGGVLNWVANDTLVFVSEADGWQHLYAMAATGGTAKLLTPGNCEVEQWSFDAEHKNIVFNSNCGDIDRRHLWSVKVDGSAEAEQVTKGSGVEWNAVFAGNSREFAYLGSDATHPGQVYVDTPSKNKEAMPVSLKLPSAFPSEQLVEPQQVVFKSADGLEIHGQLFLPKNLKAGEKRPALIFLHGGSMRQMLLGWHYMYYYANAYAMNQYLAQRGYLVLANQLSQWDRLWARISGSIGSSRPWGHRICRRDRGWKNTWGRATMWMQSELDCGAGAMGGYLTALGLGRNSDLFAAGVDMHGVHDWPTDNWEGKNITPELTKLAHDSSPIASVDTWKSPALFIHGDDDRNVMFSQSVDLVARLRARGVHVELLIFPDEIHDFLLNQTWLKAYQASSDFFDKQFQMPQK